MTCKRNWGIDYNELEAALMKSFHQMCSNSWKKKTAGGNTLGWIVRRSNRNCRKVPNPFKFQGEKTAADHTGAKEKVAAKKKSKVMSHETSTASIEEILSSQQLSPGLLPLLGAHGMEENQWLEVSPSWSCTFMQKGASSDDKAAPSKPLLVLLLQLGCAGDSCDLPGQRMTEEKGGFDRPMAGFARSQHGSPKAFVFLYLMCYCNAVNIWANFWCRTSPSALC